MNKIPKIAVSFLLILSIIINPFASVLDIRARASGTAVAFGKFVVDFIIEQIIFQAGNQMWQYSIENPEAVGSAYKFTAFNNFENFITAGDVIQVEYDIYKDGEGVIGGTYKPTGFYLDPLNTSNATEEQIETYQLIVDTCNEYIAEGGDIEFITNNIGGAYFFNPSGYEELKTKLTNKFIQKSLAEANADMISNGVVPSYDFNFVGPSPSLQFPGGTTISTSTMAGGFVYTSPLPSNSIYTSGYYAYPLTAELAESIGADSYVQQYDYCDVSWYRTCYGASHYCLFNGKLYFNQAFWYSDSDPTSHILYLENPHYSPQWYYCADGTSLVDDGFNSNSEYSIGLAFNMTNEHKSSIPIKTTLTEDEFVTTTEDKSVEIPRTEEEDIIGQAIGLGLINPDSALEFNEDGTIAGADGLTLAKLQELIDMISEGKLDFESIQEYLDLITKLVASGNYTATEQKAILDNIEALNQASAKSLEEINASVLAISQALTLEGELEDVETEFSYLDVEHTGLVEAETIVNTALPIVGQAKQLVTNVFNSVDESSEVPNFNFYWDSNKDGEVEKYNFFDLSFMEQPLTNANLEDKSRFTDVMTVREFIQYIIIFVVYAGYLIKLLRRIPGLLGGSEGMADDVNTINSNRG